MSELVNKTTEDIKNKLYDCLQSTFEEIETVKHHLSCIYEGIANDLDIMDSNSKVKNSEYKLAEFIIKNWHHCPIPIEVVCKCGFRGEGCIECLLRHADSLNLPKED